MKNDLKKRIKRYSQNLFMPVIGLFSLFWVLYRVIPKPQRLTYPCMKAAAPIATGFLIWVFGTITAAISLLKARAFFKNSRYALAGLALFVALVSSILFNQVDNNLYADHAAFEDIADEPVGQARGVMPGRVIWAHDPDATRDNCSLNIGDGYFLSKNTDIEHVQKMVDASLLNLSGQETAQAAWNELFTYFNELKGKGKVSYQPGEKIYIKTNFVGTNGCNSNFEITKSGTYKTSRTSPQVVLAIFRNLVNVVGVAQEDISVGDPMQCIVQDVFNIWYAEFPKINYIDQKGGKGRTQAQASDTHTIFYSDRGEILREGDQSSWVNVNQGDPVESDAFYTCIEHADYMINIAALKAHHRAGITLCAKNHFGSHTRSSARQLHMGLVNPNGVSNDELARFGYGQYRIQVDLLGHKYLGGNTVLSIVDGLWGGPDAGASPQKFKKAPFNNDWTSSIFMSQDQVALESVCFDILKNEWPSNHPGMYGVDDYLLQAASSEYWPEGFVYDPEKDGTPVPSLGVHDHWNNATDRQYGRNLGKENGIELVYLDESKMSRVTDTPAPANLFFLQQNYPNPFNPSTTIQYEIPETADVQIAIYSVTGQLIRSWNIVQQNQGMHAIRWNGLTNHNQQAAAGFYYCRMTSLDYSQTIKMTLLK